MDKELLGILACPKCKNNLVYVKNRHFTCRRCRLRFAIKNGIPNMIIEEAEKIR